MFIFPLTKVEFESNRHLSNEMKSICWLNASLKPILFESTNVHMDTKHYDTLLHGHESQFDILNGNPNIY